MFLNWNSCHEQNMAIMFLSLFLSFLPFKIYSKVEKTTKKGQHKLKNSSSNQKTLINMNHLLLYEIIDHNYLVITTHVM